MKKVLLGCGAVIVIMIVLGVIAGMLVARSVRRANTASAGATADLTATNREFPFAAPADGQLAEARFEIWLKVRGQALDRDQQRRSEMRGGGPMKKVRLFFDERSEVLGEFQALLNTEKMSLAEYLWITDQVMGALLSRPAAKDPKLAGLARLAQSPDPSMRGPRLEGGPWRRLYAPLDPSEARPILALIQKHEEQYRKVARRSMGDLYLERVPLRRADFATTGTLPRREDRATTR